MNWLAFIVVQASLSAQPLTVESRPGPTDVEVSGSHVQKEPDITLHVANKGGWGETRIVGVQAETYVAGATPTTIPFATEALCATAADVLRKQAGILSVSCVQTE